MSKLQWDKTGERYFENGVSNGVLYLMNASGAYPTGVAWNGLTGIDENPDGGDTTDLWADNIKYASFRNPENYGGNIKAYTYPDEWKACDGMKSPDGLSGMTLGQQTRAPFGLCYRTEVSNDAGAEEYILHLVYNCTVSPSSKSHTTKNENPDAVEMSWDYKSTPVVVSNISGVKTTSTVEIDSRNFTDDQMAAIEAALYGVDADAEHNITAATPYLPSPDQVATILQEAAPVTSGG